MHTAHSIVLQDHACVSVMIIAVAVILILNIPIIIIRILLIISTDHILMRIPLFAANSDLSLGVEVNANR
jgi:hypothetical protein